MKYICLVMLLFFGVDSVWAQHIIQGKITDAKTHEPIPFVTVGIKGTPRGTITNELGEFIIQAAPLPATLAVTHLSYEPLELQVADENPVNITLQPQTTRLREVIVGDEAVAIMRHVAARISSTVDSVYNAKVFFRQSAMTGNKNLFFFAESFMDMQWQSFGFTNYYITNSRYLEAPGGIPNKNIATVSLLICGMVRNFTLNPIIFFPADHRGELIYRFEISKRFFNKGHRITVISCKLREQNSAISAFEGDYYIDTYDYSVLKIDGEINNFRINGRPIETRLQSQFKVDKKGHNILEYSSFTSKAAYNTGSLFDKRITLSTTLYALSYDQDILSKRLKPLQTRTYDTDQARFKAIPYDAGFWKANAIIKRTPDEDKAIAEMEKHEKVNGNMLMQSPQTH